VGVRDGTRRTCARARAAVSLARGAAAPRDRRHRPDRGLGRARGEARGAAAEVDGFDPEPCAEAARARGAIDEPARRSGRLAGADLAVVAAPVAQLAAQVRAAAAAATTTVTDVGSTKSSLGAARGSALRRRPPGLRLGGSRPRARERDLFDGATWFLTPRADRSRAPPARPRLRLRARRDAGRDRPEAHDRLVALTSHLPHALANLLVNQAGATRVEGHEPLAAAGGSLRDMTRVAGANPRIWVDIFLENAARSASRWPSTAAGSSSSRPRSRPATPASSPAGSARRRATAGACSRRVPGPGELHQLRVHVPDRPGVLAGITQALGAQRINIEDFELHHVSPERGGTLTLLVTGEARRARAPRCSSRRATASSSRRCWPNEGSSRPPRCAATSRSRRQVDLAPRRAARRDRRGRDARARLRPLGGHRGDDRGRRALGVTVHEDDVDALASRASACAAARARGPIDCGNSGTTLRLLAGILAGQHGPLRADGDDSLRGRPMRADRRAAAQMGARSRHRRRRAARDRGRRAARIRYELPVASAQVKSCVLLAGLYARGGRPSSSRCRRATTPS
jgi:prephenate dehydrogenase